VLSAPILGLRDVVQASFEATSVVIDGPTVAGKSTLAEKIRNAQPTSRSVVVLSYDAFLRPRTERQDLYDAVLRGAISPQQYHARTWDLSRIDETIARAVSAVEGSYPHSVLLPVAAGREVLDVEVAITIDSGTLLIVEGTGSLLPERARPQGLAIWCAAPDPEVAIARKLDRLRERGVQATNAEVRARYLGADQVHDRWVEFASRPRADVIYLADAIELAT
jgi:uridine kinase